MEENGLSYENESSSNEQESFSASTQVQSGQFFSKLLILA